MRAFLLHADDVVRGRPWTVRGGRGLWALAGLVAAFGVSYGAVMGTYGVVSGERVVPSHGVVQMVYSGLKVPLLLVTTFLITLPSFFVLNTLLGLRDDFGEAVQALLTTQAGLTIILASLAPFTAFWYVSSSGYDQAILFNGLMFAVASVSAQWMLRRHYRPLVARHPRHRVMMRTWLIIYVFVGVQMGWLLRPFIGAPDMPPQFLRTEAWGNAYVHVARMIWQVIAR